MNQVRDVDAVVEAIKPYLAGRRPEIAGAVLADLVAMWLAGHVVLDDRSGEVERAQTDAMRTRMLDDWTDTVRKLTPVNEGMILAQLKAGRS